MSEPLTSSAFLQYLFYHHLIMLENLQDNVLSAR